MADNYKIHHNVATGQITKQALDEQELAQRQITIFEIEKQIALQVKADTAKAAAQAKLAALGLTAEDLKALGL